MAKYELRFVVDTEVESTVQAMGEALMEAVKQARAVATSTYFKSTELSEYTVVRMVGEEV